MAGLSPWTNKADFYGKHVVVPSDADLLGRLFQKIARLRAADFLTIPRSRLADVGGVGAETRWLLFCTHPLREVENTLPVKARPYLTFYAFPELVAGEVPVPDDFEGADAEDVHRFIAAAERHALADGCSGESDGARIDEAKVVGKLLRGWIESATKFGAATFLEAEKYFVPMPVTLVRIAES